MPNITKLLHVWEHLLHLCLFGFATRDTSHACSLGLGAVSHFIRSQQILSVMRVKDSPGAIAQQKAFLFVFVFNLKRKDSCI